MLRNGTTNVWDVCSGFQGCKEGKWPVTKADLDLAREMLRVGGDINGPTHFITPRLLTSGKNVTPGTQTGIYTFDFGPAVGEKVVPRWVIEYPEVPCPGCRPEKLRLYRAPGTAYVR